MNPVSISVLTICGIAELPEQSSRTVTHVLSLLDPDWPEIETFRSFGDHHRVTMRFNDVIEPLAGKSPPTHAHVADILRFGSDLAASRGERSEGHLLVHCHMGVSRSTAAMLSLLAQTYPAEPEDRLFARLRAIRPQAWPNSLMIGYADDLLGRGGRLSAALRRHYGHQIKADPHFVDWMTRLGRAREIDMAVDPSEIDPAQRTA
ncbi:MAG: protein-tyrosine-phosphatase [Rhodospirillaceae bacterium]|nr:protein-tyrosine-phosphatase [Rhodospirillaceae bacterium]